MSWAGQVFEASMKSKVGWARDNGASFTELMLVASKVLEEAKQAYFKQLDEEAA